MKHESLRLKYKDVKQFFADQGCELLESTYKNARTKMKYRCSCGNETEIVFDSFRRGNRCRLCGNRKNSESQQLSHEEVAKYFHKQGCELLDEYTLSRNLVKYRCKCGNISKTTLSNFKRGKHCNECGIKQRSGENNYQWREDREKMELEYAFRQRSYKMLKWVLKVTGRVKNKKTTELLGYDYKALQECITSHPNWEKVKDGKWHVDHIFPIQAFLDYGIHDLKIINALDNLRPLSEFDNCSKHAKYNKQEFEQWLKKKGWELDETSSNGL